MKTFEETILRFVSIVQLIHILLAFGCDDRSDVDHYQHVLQAFSLGYFPMSGELLKSNYVIRCKQKTNYIIIHILNNMQNLLLDKLKH